MVRSLLFIGLLIVSLIESPVDDRLVTQSQPSIHFVSESTIATSRTADEFATRKADHNSDHIVVADDSETIAKSEANESIVTESEHTFAYFGAVNWLVLIAYAVSMIVVGWFYSRSNDVEDYLLGGRQMKPWAVGISLFATLMSTLTYLSYPGEMILHGPLILTGMLSYPLVYIAVGRLIIPRIMALRVTSAYEILELRLGVSVRMLGSAMFLALRLMWMSMIVFATSSTVIVPLLQLSPDATPWVCALLGFVTIVYTSMGGFRAVVFTDVAQSTIMIVGVIASLVIISSSLGGISGWWPHSWMTHWDQPSRFIEFNSRVSVGAALITTFTWYLCTAGSDQMAIQRYLSTRDVVSARRMFGISLCCDVVTALLLALFGLALLAYFRAHPALLPSGETLYSKPDQLLPLFMVKVAPTGMGGLIMAGILSAAMDSLSSGLNSSSSVIAIDWVGRFRRVDSSELHNVRQVKIISCAVGSLVVLLSLYANTVSGNLLEKCYTVVNLFTAPLFVLFFMAMFVPWATTCGTWIAALASSSVAFAVAYGSIFSLSFLWITPLSLLSGVVVGCVASFLPIGASRPMIEITK